MISSLTAEKHHIECSQIHNGNGDALQMVFVFPLQNPTTYEKDCVQMLSHIGLLSHESSENL